MITRELTQGSRKTQPYRDLPWRIEHEQLITWHQGKQDLDQIHPKALQLISLARTIPKFVWDRVGYRPNFD